MHTTTAQEKRKRLREMMAAPGVIQAAGVADAANALIVQSVGYPALYISGSFVNFTHGLPDGGLTMMEIAARVREIADRIDIPVIADADEGFGGVAQLVRTVHEFELAGASAIHLEDMATKKHGHPMPIKEATNRIKAALDARSDPNFVIIARTDAMAPWRAGLEQNRPACEAEAFERCVAYAEAGADMIMVMYPAMDWVRQYGNRIPKPILPLYGLNVSHRAPGSDGTDVKGPVSDFTAQELEPYNVKLVIYPVNIVSRTFGFIKREYAKWLQEGIFVATEQDAKDRWESNVLIGVPEKYALLKKYEE